MSLTKDEIAAIVQQSIQAGIAQQREDEETRYGWVDREKHHKHHELIDEAIAFFADTKKTIWRILLGLVIVGLFGLTVAGAVSRFKGG